MPPHRRFALRALLAAVLLAAVIQPVQAQRQSDYLAADLRSRVGAFKADFASQPTNNGNLAERKELVWH